MPGGPGWLHHAGNRFPPLLQLGLPLTLCTIYEGNIPEPDLHRAAATALAVFNEAILRCAFSAGLPVIDLRMLCNTPADYANPIEPSATGGDKIARVIATVVATHDFATGRSAVYGTRKDI